MDICLANETAAACARGWLPGISTIIAALALGFTALQFWLSRKTAQRQLRAYVGLKAGGIGLSQDDQGHWIIEASADIENFGNTPAYNFKTYCQVVGVFPNNADPYDDAPTIPTTGGASSILFPRKTVKIGARAVISDADLPGLNSGQLKIFLRGGAEFTDIFTCKRYFKFFDMNGSPHDQSHWTVQPHPRGYEAN